MGGENNFIIERGSTIHCINFHKHLAEKIMENPIEVLAQAIRNRHTAVLATVVNVISASLAKVGSHKPTFLLQNL